MFVCVGGGLWLPLVGVSYVMSSPLLLGRWKFHGSSDYVFGIL